LRTTEQPPAPLAKAVQPQEPIAIVPLPSRVSSDKLETNIEALTRQMSEMSIAMAKISSAQQQNFRPQQQIRGRSGPQSYGSRPDERQRYGNYAQGNYADIDVDAGGFG